MITSYLEIHSPTDDVFVEIPLICIEAMVLRPQAGTINLILDSGKEVLVYQNQYEYVKSIVEDYWNSDISIKHKVDEE